VGGVLVAVVAPALLRDYYELPAFVLGAFGVLLVALWREPPSPTTRSLAATTRITLATVLVAAALVFAGQTRTRRRGTVASARGFYGVLTVQDHPPGLMHDLRVLRQGRIFHGAEFLDSARVGLATAYFTAGSGVELAIRTLAGRAAGKPVHMGVIGLGVGTLAAWGHAGDIMRFYEIDPAAERLARRYFTYLDGSAARLDVVLGDGRLSLERDVAAAGGRPLYDILVVDAFAGDAVPVHLLTRECADLYRRAVGPRGLIVFQITNRHVDLGRVVRGLAVAEGMQAVRIDQAPPPESGGLATAWMVLEPAGASLPPELLAAATAGAGAAAAPSSAAAVVSSSRLPPVLWTDDFSNLLRVLR
jgi:hypothetical protein